MQGVWRHHPLIPSLTLRKVFLHPELIPPLSCCLKFGDPQSVAVLLSHGADPMARDACHRTGLHVACNKDYASCVDTLLAFASESQDSFVIFPPPLLWQLPLWWCCLGVSSSLWALCAFLVVAASHGYPFSSVLTLHHVWDLRR